MPLALRVVGRHARLVAHLLAVRLGALGEDQGRLVAVAGLLARACGDLVDGLALAADLEYVHGAQDGRVEVGLVGVWVAVHGGVDPSLDPVEGGAEAPGQTVADGVVEVIAKDQVVAGYVLLELEGIGNAVSVAGVVCVFEVGRACWGAFGQAWFSVSFRSVPREKASVTTDRGSP